MAPELFRFSGGDLSGAAYPAVILANDVLEINWNISLDAQANASDQMMVLIYDTVNSRTLTRIFAGSFRAAGTYSIAKSELLKGAEADVYIGFVAAVRSAQSDSQYLGSGTWKKKQELDVIKSGSIWYKQADVHDIAVEIDDDVAGCGPLC